MKAVIHLGTLIAVALATTAHGDPQSVDPVAVATPQVVDQLTGIDFTAPKLTLDGLLGSSAVAALNAIGDADQQISPGVRVRAIRALSLYPSDDARLALRAAIAKHGPAVDGVELLELRAALEALGQIGDPSVDVTTIVPLLDKEESKDIRAAAARALRDLGSSTAIAPLHARLARETDPQVQFWISDALRVLSGTPQ